MMYTPGLGVSETIVNFNIRTDTREQCRIQVGQKEVGISNERQTGERTSVPSFWELREVTYISEGFVPW